MKKNWPTEIDKKNLRHMILASIMTSIFIPQINLVRNILIQN